MLGCCIEYILTKDALYLLSYISMLPFDNDNTIPQSKQKCKRKNQIFPKILPRRLLFTPKQRDCQTELNR